MQKIKSEKIRSKRLYFYFSLSCIIWGLIILPIIEHLTYKSHSSAFIFLLTLPLAIMFTLMPFGLGNNWPPEGKEYQMLYYPLISIPTVWLGYFVKNYFIW